MLLIIIIESLNKTKCYSINLVLNFGGKELSFKPEVTKAKKQSDEGYSRSLGKLFFVI